MAKISRRSLFSIRLRGVFLFSWSIEQDARDTQMTTRGTKSEEKGDCSQSNFHFFLHFFLINLLTLYRLKLIFVTIKSAVLHAKLYRVPQQIMLDDTSYELVKIHLKRLASPLHLVNNYPPLSPTCMKVNY